MSSNLQSPVLSETGLQFWGDQWVCDRSERGFKGELGSDGRNHLGIFWRWARTVQKLGIQIFRGQYHGKSINIRHSGIIGKPLVSIKLSAKFGALKDCGSASIVVV